MSWWSWRVPRGWRRGTALVPVSCGSRVVLVYCSAALPVALLLVVVARGVAGVVAVAWRYSVK